MEEIFNYKTFQDYFRGSESLIKERQQPYLRYLENCSNVLEIGSGRGEFLELLRDANIKALGIDSDPEMVQHCKAKGLDIVEADALEFLQKAPDHSYDGIILFQVAEHLSLENLLELIELMSAKICAGGKLIIETPNPHCAKAMQFFLIDPTHIRPIHPELLEFMLAKAGFKGIDCVFSTGDDKLYSMKDHPRWLWGDYAYIAERREADDEPKEGDMVLVSDKLESIFGDNFFDFVNPERIDSLIDYFGKQIDSLEGRINKQIVSVFKELNRVIFDIAEQQNKMIEALKERSDQQQDLLEVLHDWIKKEQKWKWRQLLIGSSRRLRYDKPEAPEPEQDSSSR